MTGDTRALRLALFAQKKRLAELVELCGSEDPTHPLQKFSLQKILWLEKRIAEIQEKPAQ